MKERMKYICKDKINKEILFQSKSFHDYTKPS